MTGVGGPEGTSWMMTSLWAGGGDGCVERVFVKTYQPYT